MSTLVLGSYVHAHCLQLPALPSTGQTLLANRYWAEHGGKGLNVGVGLQRLGAETALLLPVGDDHAGRQITEELQQQGIDTRWVVCCGAQSGYGVGLIDEQGNNVISVFPGANAQLNAQMVGDTLSQCPRLHTIYAQLEIPLSAVMHGFSLAYQRGLRTVLNPSPWQPLPSGLLQLTRILVVNANEAAGLFTCQPNDVPASPEAWLQALPDLAQRIGWQGDWLIVTLGHEGCLALGHEYVFYQAAWSVVACDVTGAGDAFNAGLLWALDHQTFEQALISANACGAYVSERSGVLANLPNPAELESFMQQRPQPSGQRIKRAF